MSASRLFVTVARTGTMDKLEKLGTHPCPLEFESEWQDGEILFTHCYDKMMPLIRDAYKRGIAIITTARSEADSRVSARALGIGSKEMDEQWANYAEVKSLASVVIQYDAGATDAKVLEAIALDHEPAKTAERLESTKLRSERVR